MVLQVKSNKGQLNPQHLCVWLRQSPTAGYKEQEVLLELCLPGIYCLQHHQVLHTLASGQVPAKCCVKQALDYEQSAPPTLMCTPTDNFADLLQHADQTHAW